MNYQLSSVIIPEGWETIFNLIYQTEDFNNLCDFLNQEHNIYGDIILPPKNLIYNAFYLTKPENVKVVIIGQDPYHNINEAMGLSFSVNREIRIPPSLRNIFQNVKKHYPDFVYSHGDLSNWAKQGVLLLNSSLTVRNKVPNSHQKYWRFFTNQIINWLSNHYEHIVFMLWGNDAKKKKILIDESKHLILEGIHPSPLSNRIGGEHPFINLNHFVVCNDYLLLHSKSAVNWLIMD